MSIKTSLHTVATFTRISTRRFFRDKLALFFGVVFPLIFLFIFGGLNSGSGDVSFKIGVINKSDSAFAKDFARKLSEQKALDINEKVTDETIAKEKMDKSEISALIILPENFGDSNATTKRPSGELQIKYTQNNQQSGQTLASIMNSIFKDINEQVTATSLPFTVKTEEIKQKSLSAFDYAFAGLLGFSIIGIGIFGPMNIFPELKKMGILRRLSTTPIRVWQYFLSTAASQVVTGFVGIVAMFIVGILVFKLNVIGNWFELFIFLCLSIVTILGIGLAVGGWAKNERQAAPLGNAVVFPLMFLSGTFFPRFLMPEWLQTVSGLLPLSPIIDGLRMITTEGKHLIDLLPQVGLICGWAVVIYLIAFRVFRWE